MAVQVFSSTSLGYLIVPNGAGAAASLSHPKPQQDEVPERWRQQFMHHLHDATEDHGVRSWRQPAFLCLQLLCYKVVGTKEELPSLQEGC